MVRGMFRADAIVVLGCRIGPSGRPGLPAARRAATGASAYLAGVAPRIVVSGGRRWGSQIEARALGRAMVSAGVPAGAVVEELCSLSTFENAIFSAAVLAELGARRAAVVTCPWHMARALQSFRAAGVEALPLPTGVAEIPRLGRLYLEVHERVCTALDARADAPQRPAHRDRGRARWSPARVRRVGRGSSAPGPRVATAGDRRVRRERGAGPGGCPRIAAGAAPGEPSPRRRRRRGIAPSARHRRRRRRARVRSGPRARRPDGSTRSSSPSTGAHPRP